MNTPLILTPLQEAAAERIRFFQNALKEKGYHVRLAMEQEFAIAHDGKPAEEVFHSKSQGSGIGRKFNKYHEQMKYLKQHHPTVTMLERELASTADNLQVYEAKFDSGMMARHSPLEVALDVLRFRKETVRELLSRETFLYSDWAGKELSAIFKAVPFADRPKATTGLHASMGVYDSSGKNLFVAEDGMAPTEFMYDVAERLKELQRDAGLGFIQNEDSLQRYGSNESVPYYVAVGLGKGEAASLLHRQEEDIFGTHGRNQTQNHYLENKMPSAGADPLVVAALQLAAVYDEITRNPKGSNHGHHVEQLCPDRQEDVLYEKPHEMDETMGQWTQRFSESAHLKSLLGDTLYQGIIKEYGTDHAMGA